MTISALIQRGFDNAIANWQLLLIRIAGSVAVTMVVLAAIVPIVMFAIYSGTMTGIELIDDQGEMIDWLLSNAIVIGIFIIVLTLIIAVAVAIHSFITGGVAGIYLDADRAAPRANWIRRQLAVFSPDRWLLHGRRTWWPIFVLYNLTWGIWTILLLLPLLLVVPLLIAADGRPEAGFAACAIIVGWVGVAIGGSIVVHIWTELAIITCVREGGRILAPLRRGLSILMSNFVKVIVLLVLMFAVTFGLAGVSFAAQFGFEMGSNVGEIALLLVPIQIVFSVIQTVISVVAGAWLMACFATIVNESTEHSAQGASLATPPSTTT